ncbi:MAG: radical SAM family heme chaperone HemW [Bdellovibrionota bacterium]
MLSPGLYVHVPFCVHKCGYCDFNSWAEESREPQERWLKALEKQSRFWGERNRNAETPAFETVFWGGGTPSLLEPDIIEKATTILRDNFSIADGAEWTLECNPETLTSARLAHMHSIGVNRISIGIQSFEDVYLDRLERRARRADNLKVLELVASEWKGRWSLDLMFGLPEQSVERWEAELRQALEFSPAHISAYQLTLTTARSKNWKQPDIDTLLEMFEITEERLAAKGLAKYEVSNFCRPGEESRHNLKYWELEPFLGLGPGASGLLASRQLEGVSKIGRFGAHQKQPDNFDKWENAAGQGLAEIGTLLTPRSGREHLEEILMMGLRLRKGLDLGRLEGDSGEFNELFKKEQDSGNIELYGKIARATRRGEQVLDSVLQRVFTEIEKIRPQFLDSASFDPKF